MSLYWKWALKKKKFYMKRRWWEKFLNSHLKFMSVSFRDTGAHGASIFTDYGTRTLQCHYFPSVGPAGLNPPSSRRSLFIVSLSLFMHTCRVVSAFLHRVFITDPSSSLWITKGGQMWLQFSGLFLPRSPRFLFTARLGCSQDSQETHVATKCCAACKHRPSLTCVYPTTLIGYCCAPLCNCLSRYQQW